MITKDDEIREVLVQINILLNNIDISYNGKSTHIKNIGVASTKYVLEHAAFLLAAALDDNEVLRID